MSKKDFERHINARIDELIMSGMKKPEERAEYKKLTRWHKTYVLNYAIR